MDYLAWNKLIASHFFRPEMADNRVYLYVTEDIISSIGKDKGVDFQDFINAVKTSVGMTKNGICQKAWRTMEEWKYRQKRQGYPPYIGYLALFVLAAGTEEDFSANAYYPRLRKLLGEKQASKPYPDFDQMRIVWKDLEKWANTDKDGEWGIFNINISGRLIHVGIPISQTILTEKELKALPIIFAEAGLDSNNHFSERAIAFWIGKYGYKYLRKRTIRLLKETSARDELRQALIDRIIDELSAWDGTAEISSEAGKRFYGTLRLCCKLDTTAKSANFTVRCSTNREFPEDKLVLKYNSDSYYCDEYGNGYSSAIRSNLNDKTIDASLFDWCQNMQMESDDKRWCFNFIASPVRVFVKGENQGLQGYVEVGRIPQGLPFYLAAHQNCCPELEKWGKSGCTGFQKSDILQGLPSGWHFFRVESADSDQLVRDKFPILSFSTSVLLELKGGIRVDKGNYFFKFAPPQIVLAGADSSVKLYCNQIKLDSSNTEGIYQLPTYITAGTKIEIEARRGEDVIKRLFLFLEESFAIETIKLAPYLDYFGNFYSNLDNKIAGVIGAWIGGVNCPLFDFNTLLPLQGRQKIFFVGKEPGQIVTFPDETLPLDWHPVWAIAKGRLFNKAMFCSSSLKESEPHRSTCNDKIKLQQWQEILSTRTLPPLEDNRLQDLWKKFQKEAQRVRV